MAESKKTPRKMPSMLDEDRVFFESAYKNNPKAREAMDAAGVTPVTAPKKPAVKKSTAATAPKKPAAAKAPARKGGKK